MAQDTLCAPLATSPPSSRHSSPSTTPLASDIHTRPRRTREPRRKGKQRLILPIEISSSASRDEQENMATQTADSQNQANSSGAHAGSERVQRGESVVDPSSPAKVSSTLTPVLEEAPNSSASGSTSRKRPNPEPDEDDLVIVEDVSDDIQVVSVGPSHLHSRKRVAREEPRHSPSRRQTRRTLSPAAGDEEDTSLQIIHERLPTPDVVVISDDDEPLVSRVSRRERETLADSMGPDLGLPPSIRAIRRHTARLPNASRLATTGSSSSFHSGGFFPRSRPMAASSSSSASSSMRGSARPSQAREYHRERPPGPSMLVEDGDDFGDIVSVQNTISARTSALRGMQSAFLRTIGSGQHHLLPPLGFDEIVDPGDIADYMPPLPPVLSPEGVRMTGYEDLLQLQDAMGQVSRPTPLHILDRIPEERVTSTKYAGET